ncbi:hypothetical protein DV736_g5965, partial [Chaetothyriales sp. CBS 134916]
MDSSSLTGACSSLLEGSTELNGLILTFVREAREARQDINAFSRELSSLSINVSILKGGKFAFPDHLQSNLVLVLGDCEAIISSMRAIIERHRFRGIGRTGHWTPSDRDSVVALQDRLEARKTTLDITIELASLHGAGAVSADTHPADLEIPAVKHDTMAELEFLRAEVRRFHLGDKAAANPLLSRFLVDTLTYTESVCDPMDNSPSRFATVQSDTLSECDLVTMMDADYPLRNDQPVSSQPTQPATPTIDNPLSAELDQIYDQPITQPDPASDPTRNELASASTEDVRPSNPVTTPSAKKAAVAYQPERPAPKPAVSSVISNSPSQLVRTSLVEEHVLSVLQRAGCSIEDKDKVLPVYLLESCGSNQDESRAVEWLLKNGAEVNAYSTVDMMSARCTHPRILGSALHLAVIHSGFESIVPVLVRYEAELETFAAWLKDDGTAVSRGTALNLATWRGDLDSAAALVDAGADTSSYSKEFLQRCARNSVAYALISGTTEYPVTRYALKRNIKLRRGPPVRVSPSNVPAWRKFLTNTNWGCNAEQTNYELYEMYYRGLLQIYGLKAEKDGEWRTYSCTKLHHAAYTDDERSHNHEHVARMPPPPVQPKREQPKREQPKREQPKQKTKKGFFGGLI